MSKQADIMRWEACVHIFQNNVLEEELLLTNVQAASYEVAQVLVTERVTMYTDALGIKNVSIKIIELYEEHEVPVQVARPLTTAQRTQPSYNAAQRHNPAPAWKAFSCPIIDLCKERHRGAVLGTTIQLTKIVEEKQP